MVMEDPQNWAVCARLIPIRNLPLTHDQALPDSSHPCSWPPHNLGDCDLPFMAQDVIRSSVAAFNQSGTTNLNASLATSEMWANLLALDATTSTASELFSLPGFFNIPVCVIDTQVVSLSKFLGSFENNEGPSGNGHGPP